MSDRVCPACGGTSYGYLDGKWMEWICWGCGFYESNTPAFRESPQLFRDIVRKNGKYYLVKYAYYHRGTVQNPS
ncbi:MAG: hypothetical protein MN733_11820 [Nitrososphaera sp.]|nr:hypothetical protein [Nitrososphaera sp.]